MAYLTTVKRGSPDLSQHEYELIALGIFDDKQLTETQQKYDKQLSNVITGVLQTEDFRGEPGQTEILHFGEGAPAKRILLIGLGKRDQFSLDQMRKAAGTAVRTTQARKIDEFAVEVFGEDEVSGVSRDEKIQAITEGLILGSYQFTEYKTQQKEDIFISKSAAILIDNAGENAIDRGTHIARATTFVRDLAMHPSNVLTPSKMAKEAEQIAKMGGFKCRVYDRNEFEEIGMGSFAGVAKGSTEPPKFIVLEYNGGEKGDAPVAFVGKGITFDSGGISIKSSKAMDEMKFDMCGAGTVLGIFHALAALRPQINVVGAIASTENMPGGHAYKPGDILKAYNGKTIEVLNTDAEGRLALADALSYVTQEFKPKYMVNFATLTGAAIVALGHRATAVMGTDDSLVSQIIESGEYTGERCWQLPLWDEYSSDIKSDVADVKNIGAQGAGTIIGGAFLKEFVGETKWAHLDIAGTAWVSEEKSYTPKGGTGFGVRLLVDFLRHS